jgi:integrase
MRLPSPNTVVLKHEQLRLVRRNDTGKWQAHYKLDGIKKWYRQTTGTTDLDKAKKLAERMWMKATFAFEEGKPIVSKRFKPVGEIVLARLIDKVKNGTAKPSDKDYISALRIYLIPYYGKYNVDTITPSVISSFHNWRREMVGRELSGSAQNNHNAAFNLVIDEAIERGYMTEYMRPATKNTGSEGERRPEFSHEEIKKILGYMPHFVENGRTQKVKAVRELLAIYVPFMAATGMRPGTESEYLEWRHIDVEIRDDQPVLHFRLQKGKRGARNFVAHNSCWLLLEKLRQMSPDLEKFTLQEVLRKKVARRVFRMRDGAIPDNYNKPFRQLLEEMNLLYCPVTGNERSLYSLRHYYATQHLLDGTPIHDLAGNMGTSIPMITAHYSHLTPLMKARQFAGNVDGSIGGEAAEIEALMQAQMARSNILSLIEMSTGLSLPLIIQSPVFTEDFEKRLKNSIPQSV